MKEVSEKCLPRGTERVEGEGCSSGVPRLIRRWGVRHVSESEEHVKVKSETFGCKTCENEQ